MRQLKISCYHRGCWGSGSTEKVHGVKMIHASPNVVVSKKGGKISARAFWQVIAPSPQLLDKFLGVLKKEPAVLQLDIIEKRGARAYVFIDYTLLYSPYELAVEKGCVPIAPSYIENGMETHTLMVPSQNVMKDLLTIFDKDKDIQVLQVGELKKEHSKFGLTEKQREAMRIALLYDFYSWPRKITLEELAKIAGLSRRVYQEHLRKAETKLFPKIANEIITSVAD